MTIDAESTYNRLCLSIGEQMARFCMCAVLDVRFDAEQDARSWHAYTERTPGTFLDGPTDVNEALMAGMDERELWDRIWGAEYSDADCKHLDEIYHMFTQQFDGTGGLNARRISAAQLCTKIRFEIEGLLRESRASGASAAERQKMTQTMKGYQEIITSLLNEAAMQDKDVQKSALQRLDGVVKQIEKNGLDMDMTQDDVARWFLGKLRAKAYPEMTSDAADYMLLSILQTMAKNNDEPVPTSLPPDVGFSAFGHQFAEKPSKQEDAVFDYLDLVPGGAAYHGPVTDEVEGL